MTNHFEDYSVLSNNLIHNATASGYTLLQMCITTLLLLSSLIDFLFYYSSLHTFLLLYYNIYALCVFYSSLNVSSLYHTLGIVAISSELLLFIL